MNRTRVGIPTLLLLSTALCRALTKFGHLIEEKYPDNAALLAALAAANAACSILIPELYKVREWGD